VTCVIPCGPGAAESLRNRVGTGDIGPRTDVGHSNGGAAAEGAGGGRPSCNGSLGVSPPETLK